MARTSTANGKRESGRTQAAGTDNGGSRRVSREVLDVLNGLAGMKVVRLAEIIIFSASQTLKSRFGLRNTDLRILVILGLHQPLSLNEVTRRTRIDRAWISRTVRQLERRGLVARVPNPMHKRGSLLSLTRSGEAMLCDIAPVAMGHEERLLKGLHKKEVDQILDVLMARAEEIYRAAS